MVRLNSLDAVVFRHCDLAVVGQRPWYNAALSGPVRPYRGAEWSRTPDAPSAASGRTFSGRPRTPTRFPPKHLFSLHLLASHGCDEISDDTLFRDLEGSAGIAGAAIRPTGRTGRPRVCAQRRGQDAHYQLGSRRAREVQPEHGPVGSYRPTSPRSR